MIIEVWTGLFKFGNREMGALSNNTGRHVDCGDEGRLDTYLSISATVADGIGSI